MEVAQASPLLLLQRQGGSGEASAKAPSMPLHPLCLQSSRLPIMVGGSVRNNDNNGGAVQGRESNHNLILLLHTGFPAGSARVFLGSIDIATT